MNLLSRMFGAVQPAYLIRSYLIGIAFLAFFILILSQDPSGDGIHASPLVYAILCTLCFPFAKLVWDELRNLLLGDNLFLMNALFLMVLKLLITALLWAFAVFIAPLGMLYLWFRTRSPQQKTE